MEAYLDNSATTKCADEVIKTVVKVMGEDYGNPSSKHMKGVEAEKYIKEAAKIIAKSLKCQEKEILFTSGGTESNNMAVIGTAMANKRRGNHVIVSSVEHASVKEPFNYLEENGFDVTYLPVDSQGLVSLEDLKAALDDKTILVAVMYANNEIGTIEPIEQIGHIVKEYNKDIVFFVDAIQAYGKFKIYPKKLNIDLMSVSGHKIHGPKGTGFLYIRNSVKIGALIHGGAQERARRAGTHNVPGIVGMAQAAILAHKDMQKNTENEIRLRDYFISRIENEIDYVKLNGHRSKRLPNNINFCIKFVEGESLLIMLDQKGICASSGSACTSGSLDPSHVLTAIGLTDEDAHTSVRLSISEDTTKEEIDIVVEEIKKVTKRLRSMSPLYEEYVNNN